MLLLIFVNVLVIFVDEGVDIESSAFTFFDHSLVLFSTVVFTAEYIIQLWACVEDSRYSGHFGRCKWATKSLSFLQLVSLVPFYIDLYLILTTTQKDNAADTDIDWNKNSTPRSRHRFKMGMALQGLRLLRLLSCLRLTHQPLRKLILVFDRKKAELMVLLSSLMVLIMLSGVIIYLLEHDEQPRVFHSLAASMWWSAETITTLGYGDMVPQTSLGQFYASVLTMAGIFIFAVPAGVVSAGFVEGALERNKHDANVASSANSRAFERKVEQKLDQIMRVQEVQHKRQEEQQATLQRLLLALDRLQVSKKELQALRSASPSPPSSAHASGVGQQ
jgi:voltage-gated potassium channel